MLDHTMLAFDLAFRYRNPVVVLADGYLGQMTGKVDLPRTMARPGLPEWAVWGDAGHRGNLIASIRLLEADLEEFNRHLNVKYARMAAEEQRAELYLCEDAEVLVVAANSPARAARAAVRALREEGWKVGLFRPVTLWPFPIRRLQPLLGRARRIVVVEAGPGQIEDELRLALSHAGAATPIMDNVRHFGGVLPQPEEIVAAVLGGRGVHEGVPA
jgi:pyruvate/2-oxoacid:ferredoxin oxidoreductase alpha subunit